MGSYSLKFNCGKCQLVREVLVSWMHISYQLSVIKEHKFFLEPKRLSVWQTLLRAAWHELPGWSWAGWVQRPLGLNSCWQPQAPIFMEISILLATACFPTPTTSSPFSGTVRHGYVRGLLEIIWIQVYKLSRLIHILSKGTHQAGALFFCGLPDSSVLHSCLCPQCSYCQEGDNSSCVQFR